MQSKLKPRGWLRQNRAQADAMQIKWKWMMDTKELNGIYVVDYEYGVKSFPFDGFGLWW